MARKPKRKLKRNIRGIAGQETASERQMRTAVQAIMGNPHYNLILKWIRSGVSNSRIAEAAIDRDMFEMNQKTLVGYLQYFRRAQPNICKPVEPTGQSSDLMGYDHLFAGNESLIDEEVELLRLIRLQKARLGIGFNNERELNLLIQSNRREVEELRNLLVDLAKLRGKLGNSMDINVHGYGPNVADDLKGINQDERQRQTIAMMVGELTQIAAE